jgi:molybdopterin molybdotransferase
MGATTGLGLAGRARLVYQTRMATMLPTPAEAERIVLGNISVRPAEDSPLAAAHGRVLHAPIAADRDLPPFDRVTMDGFALRAAAWAGGTRRFRVAGTQAAGVPPLALRADVDCIEIMTGAVLPAGADCVVPYEQAERDTATGLVTISATPAAGQNVHRRGSDGAAGAALVPVGARLTAREVAVAAACGCATLRVGVRPSVAVVATGDELVPVDAPAVAPHQIRRSNDAALRAALLAGGLAARVECLHLRDERGEVEATLRRVLAEFDVVLLTGGVSKGKFDFVPAVLAALGTEKKIAGVAQRPGKPFWFGVAPGGRPVFALPGNPVSAMVCFRRYAVPALRKMLGAAPARDDFVPLANAAPGHAALTRLNAVRLGTTPDGRRAAHAVACNTSGDFAELAGTDGFVELPPGPAEVPAGMVARYWAWGD